MAGRVYSTDIEPSKERKRVGCKVADKRVTSAEGERRSVFAGATETENIQKGDKSDAQNEKAPQVGESTDSENVTARVALAVPLGVRVMEEVIRFWVVR